MKTKEEKAITLIALVITIVILIILAGVAISLTIGENGLFNRAKESAQSYKEANIRETIETEIATLNIDKVSKGEKLTVEEALVEINKKEIFEEIDLLEETGTIQDYIVQLGTDEEGNVIIVKIESDKETRITTKVTPKGYTNGKVEVKISVKPDGINVTNLEIPEGMTKKEEGIYEVTKNGNYLVRATLSNGQTIEKEIEIATIDTLKPKDFTISAVNRRDGILINAETEDEEAKDGSACTGIDRYEYYYKLSTETEYTKIQGNIINNSETSKVYNIYVIAYDKVGNEKQSNTVNITRNTNFWNEFEITHKDDAYIDEDNTLVVRALGEWIDSWVYMNSPENLHDYSKISITYSYTQGYTYGFGLYTTSGNRIINGGSDSSAASVSKQTVTFDIPENCDKHKMWLRAGSMNAYLYVYNIELIK